MRIVLQRVAGARVVVDGAETGRIGTGLLALVGVATGDGPGDAEWLAGKTAALRVFPERGGERPFHEDVVAAGGSVLVVSQFTLLGDVRHGNRPSWTAAARPEDAEPLVAAYAAGLAARGIAVAHGLFGAHMSVELTNDGPVTLVLDSSDRARPRSGA